MTDRDEGSTALARQLFSALPLLPAVLFLAVFFVYPVALLLTTSFLDNAGELSAVHYLRLYESRVIASVLLVTFKIAAWTTFFSVIAAYPVAYLLASLRRSARNTLILLVLVPFWTSFLVRTFAWIVLLGRNGALNQLLGLLGISGESSLIYDFSGVMIGMVHALMPLCILTMLATMENIDRRLLQAAATLGARPAQAFWRIYLPLSLPGVAAGALLVFITALGFFITPALLGSERETVIVQLIIFQVQDMLNWPFAGAISVLLLVVALLMVFAFDRLFGLSTLAGGSVRSDRSLLRNPIAAAGRLVGRLFIEVMAGASTLVEQVIERIFPPRADRPTKQTSRGLLWFSALLVLLFLAVPVLFIIPVSFTEERFLSWPPSGFSWHWYDSVLSSPVWIQAIARSFLIAVAAGSLGMLLGVPAAFFIVRRARFKAALIGVMVSPIIMPNIIIAVALFYLYARIGLVGTNLGLVLGHTVLAVPYVVVTVTALLRNYDTRLDHAAYTLGANKLRTFLHVTLPLMRSGLIAAFMFAFVISFDELTIALFVTGGMATTLPKKMWDDALLQVSPTLAAAATMVLVFLAIVILTSEVIRRRGAPGRT